MLPAESVITTRKVARPCACAAARIVTDEPDELICTGRSLSWAASTTAGVGSLTPGVR